MTEPQSKRNIRISLRAARLPNVASLFKGISDPYAKFYQLPANGDQYPILILGETEVVKNCLNPDFVKTMTLDYDPTEDSPLIMIKIFDEVRKNEDIFMGSVTFRLSEVLEAENNTMMYQLCRGGHTHVTAEDVEGEGMLTLKLSGKGLKNPPGNGKGLKYVTGLGRSNPFFELSKFLGHDRGWDIVHRSSVIYNNLNPHWDEDRISLSALCQGNNNMTLRFIVYDYQRSGNHNIIGEMQTSVNGLVNMHKNNVVGNLMLNNKNRGGIEIENSTVIY